MFHKQWDCNNIFLTLASTLQSQKYETNKHRSPHTLRLSSPICVQILLLGTTIKIYDFRITNFYTKFLAPPYKASTTRTIIDNVEVQDRRILHLFLLLYMPPAQHTDDIIGL